MTDSNIESVLNGLSDKEVAEKVNQGLVNKFQEVEGRTYWRIVQENVFTFINLILAFIALLLIYFGRVSDGVIYFSVALLNILVGLVQEIQAKRKLNAISSLVSPKVTVIRSGKQVLISSQDIVEGDLVFVKSGDIISVDGIIIEGSLNNDESLLTGESHLIEKKIDSEVFAGSNVVTGTAYFKAHNVGEKSTANQINSKAKAYVRHLTPVQKEVNLAIRLLFVIAVTLGAMVAMAAYLSRTPLSESLQITAVILGIIPNSLFAMINLSYALGGVNILRKGALVQKLNAVESLSNVDILCLDKTGTLTTKNLILEEIVNVNAQKEDTYNQLLHDFVCGVNDPNATVDAIIKNLQISNNKSQVVVDQVPFSSTYKWSSIASQNHDIDQYLYLGAPEILIKYLTNWNEALQQKLEDAQEKGLRVVLFATGDKWSWIEDNKTPILPQKLQLNSVLIFSDQIRDDAQLALKKFYQAGVAIKIISGDNPKTVASLARQINLQNLKHDNKGTLVLLSGDEVDKLNDLELAQKIESVDIFGRITPHQKERLIKALIDSDHYVAMIGDGVNDVMSLKQASLSIAMQSGAQSAKSVADILLLKDSFASLPAGLIEGQKIRNGLEDVFKLFVSRILYLILLIIGVRIIGLPFPFTVKQASFISALTTGIPAIGLTLWAHSGYKKRNKLFNNVLHFVLPAAFTLAFFGLIILFAMTTIKLWNIRSIDNLQSLLSITTPQVQLALASSLPRFRSVLTVFLIFAGLCLNIFVSPPVKYMSFGSSHRSDWRPAILSCIIATGFCIGYLFPDLRNFWDLTYLNLTEIFLLILALGSWLVTITVFWKYRLLDKMLGIDFGTK
jgi:cation-transporting P-type ATPase E